MIQETPVMGVVSRVSHVLDPYMLNLLGHVQKAAMKCLCVTVAGHPAFKT